MPTVLLAGAFGQGNPGDEALLDAFLAALPGWDAVATSNMPTTTMAEHGCDAVASGDVRAVALAARRADAVVVGGGTVFKALHPSTGRSPADLLRKSLLLTLGAQALGAPVALVGVGAAPLPSGTTARLARGVVRRADLLVLRDEESAAVLAEVGAPVPLRVGADAAWTLLAEPPVQPDRGADVVVAVSHLAGGADLPVRLADGLRPLADAGMPIRLQPWQPTLDGAVADAVVAALPPSSARVVDPPRNLVDARATFAGAGVVVGLRFHSLVAAASAGVPFVAVGHEPKLTALARRLDQPSVAVNGLSNALAPAVRHSLAGPGPSPAAVRSQVALAEEGFRLLRLLLDGGRTTEPDELAGLPLSSGETIGTTGDDAG